MIGPVSVLSAVFILSYNPLNTPHINNLFLLPVASDSAWALASSTTGTGVQSFTSTKPNGPAGSYYSCFSFNAANVKWIGYSMQIVTTGTDALNIYAYDSLGAGLGQSSPGSGNTTWQRKVYIPPANAYTYEWCYHKTSTATGDAAWIDDIELH